MSNLSIFSFIKDLRDLTESPEEVTRQSDNVFYDRFDELAPMFLRSYSNNDEIIAFCEQLSDNPNKDFPKDFEASCIKLLNEYREFFKEFFTLD